MRTITYALAAVLAVSAHPAAAQGTRLLRQPTINGDRVAFVYANDIWTVGREGGEARRLTSAPGAEAGPQFSPDGSRIAFTGQYDGNTDVYVVGVNGGAPERLTYHPNPDVARGWTPDGKRVLFGSGRASAPIGYNRLWTISAAGGMPEALALPMADKGAYSADGKTMAYVPFAGAILAWRHYRGGRTTPVRVIDLDDYDYEEIPRDNSNDTDPMIIGETVYFLSDRAGVMNLFSYPLAGGDVTQLTSHDDFDIKSASAGPESIVYEQAGYIHEFDPGSGDSRQLEIEVRGDLPWARERFAKVDGMIRSAELSPDGKRAVFEARGEIFTLPADKGDARNLTRSPGVHDRSPAWSPDGARIAWFSDASGEYELVIRDQAGFEPPQVITFEKPSFYYAPAWSPDSQKILFTDKHMNLWFVDINTAEATLVDSDGYSHPERSLNPVWSSDSRWMAYSKRIENQMHAIFVHSLDSGESRQLTDGMSDAVHPAFDRGGKYLYFLASTNFALNTGWLDLTSSERPVRRGVYLAVLANDEASPLLPESDEVEIKAEEEKEAEEPEETESSEDEPEEATEGAEDEESDDEKDDEEVRIDFGGIDQRILALDAPVRQYNSLVAGAEGSFFYGERVENQSGTRLHRYDLEERETKKFLDGVGDYTVSADGKKLLYVASGKWSIVGSDAPPKAGDGVLKTGNLEARISPRAEWRQIYSEAWRIWRDFFYDDGMQGADWQAMFDRYEPWLEHVGHRTDLTYIINQLMGETTVGHANAYGGDTPRTNSVTIGLLGADVSAHNGRYRIDRVLTGENWNPGLRAPLTAPGVELGEGDYILEVNGRELIPPTNFYSLFEGTAGRQTSLRVNDTPSLEGSRRVTIVPVRYEGALRSRDWVEGNRRKVNELSEGKLAYVYLPNTGGAGFTYFNRYYFAQQHKQGAVIDERFNGGGSAADYIVDLLDRPLLNYWATRDGKNFTTPNAAIFGPKVMIINEYAGSGGDALPFYFRKREIGPLVGKRTWGGLVGIYDYPQFIDGGSTTAPRVAFYNTEGEWDVENIGVAPDIEVEYTPADVIAGHDTQLEAAVAEALRLLEANPPAPVPRPEPIDRTAWQRDE